MLLADGPAVGERIGELVAARNADSGAMNDAFVDHGPNVLMPSARARHVYRALVVSSASTS